MSDPVAFLRARLDEDESAAREAAGLTECWVAEEPAIGVVLVDGEPLIEGHITGLTAHIARHDPARVLREVAAKRAILAVHAPDSAGCCFVCITNRDRWQEDWPLDRWPCQTFLALAAVYSDHPDYRDEWKPPA